MSRFLPIINTAFWNLQTAIKEGKIRFTPFMTALGLKNKPSDLGGFNDRLLLNINRPADYENFVLN